jgi:hypothetical protein
MRSISRNLILASALLSAGASAFAANITAVNVPFDFVAHGHSYSAGEYSVRLNSDQTTVTLTNVQHPAERFLWEIGPGTGLLQKPKVGLDFSAAGSTHMLHKIRYGSLSTASLDSPAKQPGQIKAGSQSANGF